MTQGPRVTSITIIPRAVKKARFFAISKLTNIVLVISLLISPLSGFLLSKFAEAATSQTFTSTADFTTGTTVTNAVTSGNQISIDTTEFTQLTAGAEYTLGIKSDGTLWSWGLNSKGQLGVGDTTDRYVPTQIGTDTNWTKVSAGSGGYQGFGVAVKSNGTLWAWGDNTYGQLGLGDTTQRSVPTQVGVATNWAEVSAGGLHIVAVKTDGTLWAWGNNDSGRLGTGNTTEYHVPTQVGVATNWSKVVGRGGHSFALKTDSTLWAWGNNSVGQLGLGDTTQRLSPTQVGVATDWGAIYGRGGGRVSTAIKTNGDLYVWGSNENGQLGLGDTTNRTVPTSLLAGTDWLSISPSDRQFIAIKADGTLWSWGKSDYGQLGLGDHVQHTTPTQVGTDTDWNIASAGPYNTVATKNNGELWGWGISGPSLGVGTIHPSIDVTVPNQVGSDTDWDVVSGSILSAGVKSDGTLWVWGKNDAGQLGLGDTVQRNLPTQLGTDTHWEKVSIGYNFMLALKDDGTLWSWGINDAGQLGLGDIVNRSVPVQVGTDTHWTNISGGFQSSFALKDDGTIWSWGYALNGQLGLGDGVDRHVPTQIGTDTDWTAIHSTYNHALALKSNGTLWSWGSGYGEPVLGNGTNGSSNSPIQVGTDTNWALIWGGIFVSAAIKSNGTLWTWGPNDDGRLGLGDTTDRLVPTQVGTDTDWVTVSISDALFAIKSNGTMWSSGSNGAGQLGLGDRIERHVLTQIGTDTDWDNTYSKGYMGMALKTDHSLWTWGDNSYGQLGLWPIDYYSIPRDTEQVASYFSAATVSGLKVDAGSTVNWSTLSWLSESLPADTDIKFRARTSSDNITYSSWSSYFTQDVDGSTSGTGDLSSLAESQYLELELTLETADVTQTPTLTSFTVDYDSAASGSGAGSSSGSVAHPKGNPATQPNPDQFLPEQLQVYRLYNSKLTDHFYTSNSQEKDQAINSGYSDEGVMGNIYTQAKEGRMPIYRLYNSKLTNHFYTDNSAEKDQAINSGYQDEGILGYADPSNTTTIYRLYNPKLQDHFYTNSLEEAQTAISKLKYILEGYMNWLF